MQTPETATERRAIVRAVAEISAQLVLPMPMSIQFGRGIQLRLDDDDRDGVTGWAEALSNGSVTEGVVPDAAGEPSFVSVRSEAYESDRPTWLGLQRIYIWSACELPAGGEQG